MRMNRRKSLISYLSSNVEPSMHACDSNFIIEPITSTVVRHLAHVVARELSIVFPYHVLLVAFANVSSPRLRNSTRAFIVIGIEGLSCTTDPSMSRDDHGAEEEQNTYNSDNETVAS
jgi:hypothetical protein